MESIVIFDCDWGCLVLDLDFRKIDILPRLTVTDLPSFGIITNFGFLCFTLNLSVYYRNTRRFIRRHRNDADA